MSHVTHKEVCHIKQSCVTHTLPAHRWHRDSHRLVCVRVMSQTSRVPHRWVTRISISIEHTQTKHETAHGHTSGSPHTWHKHFTGMWTSRFVSGLWTTRFDVSGLWISIFVWLDSSMCNVACLDTECLVPISGFCVAESLCPVWTIRIVYGTDLLKSVLAIDYDIRRRACHTWRNHCIPAAQRWHPSSRCRLWQIGGFHEGDMSHLKESCITNV